jgi:multiple sugar transport system ATP-binding protein
LVANVTRVIAQQVLAGPRDGERWLLTGPSFRQELPVERGESLSRPGATSVWLGIRPEAVSIGPVPSNGTGIPAVIDVVSPMRGNTLVYALVEGETIVADVPSDVEPPVGENVCLLFDPAKVHAFDGESEVALW